MGNFFRTLLSKFSQASFLHSIPPHLGLTLLHLNVSWSECYNPCKHTTAICLIEYKMVSIQECNTDQAQSKSKFSQNWKGGVGVCVCVRGGGVRCIRCCELREKELLKKTTMRKTNDRVWCEVSDWVWEVLSQWEDAGRRKRGLLSWSTVGWLMMMRMAMRKNIHRCRKNNEER